MWDLLFFQKLRYCMALQQHLQLILFQMKNDESFQNDPVIKRAQQNSNFRAIKSLVTTQNCLRVAHNRIRVLQANQNKNHLKIKNQLGAIQKIEKVRNAQNQHNAILQAGKKSLQKQYHHHLEKNRELKHTIKDKITKHLTELNEEKKGIYLQIEEDSEKAYRMILQEKTKELRDKEENRVNLKKAEQNGKIHLIKFHQSKQMSIKDQKNGQISTIKQKQSNKQKQLRQLGNLQMELIQRHSQSQAAYLQVKQKLDKLLNNVKLQNKSSKSSLKVSMHLSVNPLP